MPEYVSSTIAHITSELRKVIDESYDAALAEAGVKRDDVAYLATTGEGGNRYNIRPANNMTPEQTKNHSALDTRKTLNGSSTARLLTRLASQPSSFIQPARCSRRLPASRCSPIKRSSDAMPSLMKPAFTRTAC